MGDFMTYEERRQMDRRRKLENALDEWRKARDAHQRAQTATYAAFQFQHAVRERVQDAAELLYGKRSIDARMAQFERDYESERFWAENDNSPLKLDTVEAAGVPAAGAVMERT